jgi:hypothetical protein
MSFTKLNPTTQQTELTNLGALLPACKSLGVQVNPVVRNKGNGNFILLKKGDDTFVLPVSKKATVNTPVADLFLYKNEDGTYIAGIAQGDGITEWV